MTPRWLNSKESLYDLRYFWKSEIDSAPINTNYLQNCCKMLIRILEGFDSWERKNCNRSRDTASWNKSLYISQAMVWTDRVSPYNRPGCVGVKLKRVGIDDEGQQQPVLRIRIPRIRIIFLDPDPYQKLGRIRIKLYGSGTNTIENRKKLVFNLI